MKWYVALFSSALSFSVHAQTGWMPLSRDVERPFATGLGQWGAAQHTAIRRYRISEVRRTDPKDSVRPIAILPVLDKWAGARNGRTFRWGPLVDASLIYDLDRSDPVRYKAGAGAWFDLDAGAKLNFHFDAQGWSERFPFYLDTLVRSTQVTPGEGYAYGDAPNYSHYDLNGHVSWDPGKHFNLTLGKGRNSFGEGHRSLFLSSEAYSYPYLRITTSVWHIKYVNLFSQMNDIRGAKGDPGDFHRKYSSMHYLSWNASKRLNVALFEAIVWSAGDSAYPRGFDINYLNPIIFYRPVEFNIGSPDNALLGGAINVKVGRHTLIYTQVLLDEFLLKEVRAGDGWYANKQAAQVGVVSRNAFGVDGLMLRGEWNLVRPFMYTHSDTRQNYSHMGQPLAHPYGSNFQEAIAQAEWAHGRWLHSVRTSMAWLGSDTTFSQGNNIFRPESDRVLGPNGFSRDFGYRIGNAAGYTLFHGELRTGFLLDPSTGTCLDASWMFRMRTPETGGPEIANVFRVGVACYFRDRRPEQEVRYMLE